MRMNDLIMKSNGKEPREYVEEYISKKKVHLEREAEIRGTDILKTKERSDLTMGVAGLFIVILGVCLTWHSMYLSGMYPGMSHSFQEIIELISGMSAILIGGGVLKRREDTKEDLLDLEREGSFSKRNSRELYEDESNEVAQMIEDVFIKDVLKGIMREEEVSVVTYGMLRFIREVEDLRKKDALKDKLANLTENDAVKLK